MWQCTRTSLHVLGCDCRVLNGLFLGREGSIASQLLILFLQLLRGARIRQS
jgi:hypothetical protein